MNSIKLALIFASLAFALAFAVNSYAANTAEPQLSPSYCGYGQHGSHGSHGSQTHASGC